MVRENDAEWIVNDGRADTLIADREETKGDVGRVATHGFETEQVTQREPTPEETSQPPRGSVSVETAETATWAPLGFEEPS